MGAQKPGVKCHIQWSKFKKTAKSKKQRTHEQLLTFHQTKRETPKNSELANKHSEKHPNQYLKETPKQQHEEFSPPCSNEYSEQYPEEHPKQHCSQPTCEHRKNAKPKKKKSRRIRARKAKKAKENELKRAERLNKQTRLHIAHKTSSFKKLLHKKFGFIANTLIPIWKNVQNIIMHKTTDIYFTQPSNNAIFNLATSSNSLPLGTFSLLNFGLKFCIKNTFPTNKIENSIQRFEKNVRTKYFVYQMLSRQDRKREDEPFNHKLYSPNPTWTPPKANASIENAIKKFNHRIINASAKHHNKSRPNITCLQKHALRKLVNHNKYIIIEADKNMGITIFDRETYIKQVLHEHLGNRQVYLNITDEHQTRMQDLSKRFKQFCDKHADTLGKNTVTFFSRSQEAHGDNIARFWATAKVHKTPIKLRLIIAKAGTAI